MAAWISPRTSPNLLIWLLLGSIGIQLPACGADRRQQAAEIRDQLVEKIMPYWYDAAIDRVNGGYLLADDGTGNPKPATEKMLVTQSRMIWGFSHAAIKGLGDGNRDYLKAAKQGYDSLQSHFLDPKHGGYYWTTDLQGRPINTNKVVYGESFVIYALVEYYRASGDRSALKRAMDLFHVLQDHALDRKHGGYAEHFTSDWKPTLLPGRDAMVEVPGLKSANTHLHLMEALTELYEATGDRTVRKSLESVLMINMKFFYPSDPARSCFHRNPDWSVVSRPSSAGVSYGHNVEFAWLMIRAQQVLKATPAWPHFYAHVDHALKHGYDHKRGGVYNLGMDDQPAHNTDKIWWVQAEMLAALVDSLEHRDNPAHSVALDSLLGFITTYQADPKDGIWFDTVTAEGVPKNRSKVHAWKGNYHDVRALMKFVETFSK